MINMKAESQNRNNSCDLLSHLLNTSEISKYMFSEYKGGTLDTITLIDTQNLFSRCHSFNWRKHPVKVSYDSSLSAKLSRTNPYYLFKGDQNIFIFKGSFNKIKLLNFYILQACSSLLVEGTARTDAQRGFRLISLRQLVL